MKRYLVFAYKGYGPHGGWNDFDSSFDTKEAAISAADLLEDSLTIAHVVDTLTGEIVYEA